MTSEPPAEIQTLIDAHVKGFNAQDTDLFLGVFGDTAINPFRRRSSRKKVPFGGQP